MNPSETMPHNLSQSSSDFGTKNIGPFFIDKEVFNNWSMDALAKRVISVAALAILIVGIYPLMTGVHGQQPKNALEWEVQGLRERIDRAKIDTMPTEMALIIEHQKLEDERYQEQRDFESKMIWGFLGTGGGILMAFFAWILHQFGISFGGESKGPKRRTA